ncbi:MAG: HD-GYP domain-containing protein, partial [Deltaproteobacteria bacterium]|nr:HD-GYP domain-containing protein [Deltaproteobacteria bacterium]
SVLLKPGRLNQQEEAIMRTHPVRSQEILFPLSHIPAFKAILPGIRSHHERIDGRGYPDGIQNLTIPLISRIMLIADTFDAMTTSRPYRKALGVELAYKELKLFSGRQFDQHLVEIFIKAHPDWGQIEEEITEEFVSHHFKKAA